MDSLVLVDSSFSKTSSAVHATQSGEHDTVLNYKSISRW